MMVQTPVSIIASTYGCLEQYTYAGLEQFTYGGLEQCSVAQNAVPTDIFASCHPRTLQFVAGPRAVTFAETARTLVFTARTT